MTALGRRAPFLALGAVLALAAPRGAGAEAVDVARSFPVNLVAAVDGEADVSQVLLVGNSGEVYHPAGGDRWQRRLAGGVAVDVTGAVRGPDGALFVTGTRTPLFRLAGAAWHAHPLPNRGRAVGGDAGGHPAVAIGRHVYVSNGSRWERLGRVDAEVNALWASAANRVYVATADGGLARLQSGSGGGTMTTPLAAGDSIVALAGTPGRDLYALSSSGVLLQVGGTAATPVARPADLESYLPQAIAPRVGGGIWVIGVDPAQPEHARLAQVEGTRLVAAETFPAPPPGERFAVMVSDRAGGLLVATERGHVRYRAKDAPWREGRVDGALPVTAYRPSDTAAPARTK